MARHVTVIDRDPRRMAAPSGPRGRRRRRRGWGVPLAVLATVLVTAAAGSVAGIHLLGNRYEDAVNKQDLLGAAAPKKVDGTVIPPKISGPLTFLVIGSDSRAGANANPDTADGTVAAVGGQRSDTIMLVHVPKATDRAYVISVPRDSYVPIIDKSGRPGRKDKVNAAFARGGAPRLVQTLNNYTGGRIDYPVLVDFSAIRKITDLVGGVDVVVDKTSFDPYRFLPADGRYPTTPCEDNSGRRRNCVTFKAGPLHLDGQLAEYYVRQRVNLPNGDLDRVRRQQQYLRALMAKVTASGALTNPLAFDKLLRAALGAITVDKRTPVRSLAFSLKDLRPANLTFLTLPIAGGARVPGSGSVLLPDKTRARELFTAINTDTVDRYVAKYPPNDVSHGA
jgi:LCP family protein required for cell wall assembly